MQALIDQFLDYLALERGLAKNSLIAYRRDLCDHLAFLRDRCEITAPAQVTEGAVIQYLTTLHHRQTATATICRKLTTIRQFYRYLIAERLLPWTPPLMCRSRAW